MLLLNWVALTATPEAAKDQNRAFSAVLCSTSKSLHFCVCFQPKYKYFILLDIMTEPLDPKIALECKVLQISSQINLKFLFQISKQLLRNLTCRRNGALRS